MTRLQQERLLGQIVLGARTRTACDDLNVLYGDLLAALDTDEPFRFAFLGVLAQRDAATRSLLEALEEE